VPAALLDPRTAQMGRAPGGWPGRFRPRHGYGGYGGVNPTYGNDPGCSRCEALTRVRDTEVDEHETPIGAATVRERLPATQLANAPSRSRLCLKYGVRQDFLDWRALP
jgi:hypothetical protein